MISELRANGLGQQELFATDAPQFTLVRSTDCVSWASGCRCMGVPDVRVQGGVLEADAAAVDQQTWAPTRLRTTCRTPANSIQSKCLWAWDWSSRVKQAARHGLRASDRGDAEVKVVAYRRPG